ncbi:hypothetical protein GWI33_020789 [Rhynchophorus ferrugineus]|uniref:Uncharacterized protein n=1 Tax=Rhynchophorus ferrugineus TaxID=354439 RepID=A0A834LZ19_RHYFE|nr:hypothetical protein GWI33_020789 [Rhynchophorus ferrugineus]
MSKSLRVLRLAKIKSLKKIKFEVKPSKLADKPEKIGTVDIKSIPQPPDCILENVQYQEQVRREAKKLQKTMNHMQAEVKRLNDFPKVKDYPDDMM